MGWSIAVGTDWGRGKGDSGEEKHLGVYRLFPHPDG